MSDVSAFVLAGGRSSRMGSDKAFLPIEDHNLLQHVLRTASQASDKVTIVGSKSSYAQFGDVIEDIYSGCGPLGGIHTALSATSTDLNLILSVDIPRMTPEFLRWLLHQARAAPELIIIPHAAGGPQPLCAVYRRSVLGAVTAALQKGEYKIGRLFSQVPTRIITEEEIVTGGFSAIIFQNVNTPQEYDQLLQPAVQAAEPRRDEAE